MSEIRPGVRRLFQLPSRRPDAVRAEMDDEVALHLELRVEQLVRRGMSPGEARAEASRRFGDDDAARERLHASAERREQRLGARRWLDDLRQDLRGAARGLQKAPGFALAAVLTLGVGLGATTAMFSVTDAVLLRPLPLPAPDRVVVLAPVAAGEERGGSPAFLAAWSEGARSLRAVAGLRERNATLVGREAAERLQGAAVSGAFFDVLGVHPLLGRAIAAADDAPGAAPVVVLGHALWSRAFGGDAGVVGRVARLDGTAYTVVGVMPPALDDVLAHQEFWTPLALEPSQRDNFTPYLSLVGRLRDGVAPADAARELDAIVGRLGPKALVDGVRPEVRVQPASGWLVRDYRRPLLFMLGAVALVLCIACVNVATLVLARSAARSREFALRAALGAGRGRLVRQLVAEQSMLGALATAVALVVAAGATRLLVAAVPAEVPRLDGASLDGRALAVAISLGVATTVLGALAPALQQGRLDLRSALQGGGRGATAGGRWRGWLVGAEVALAVVLLSSAGMLIRSALALGRVRPGFDLAHVLTARLALPERDYPALPAAVRGYEAVLAAVRAAPGVTNAALVSRVPLGGAMTSVDITLADRAFTAANRRNAALRITSPDYFRSMGIPLIAGRDLRAADDASAPPVVVVNATLARQLGGERAAVGRRIRSDNGAFADASGKPREMEVVGVVGDVRDGGPRQAVGAEFYAPMGQVSAEPWNYWISRELVLVARTAAAGAAAAPALRRAVASVDPRVPLYDVQSTGDRLLGALAVERFSTRLLALLGALGLALAALGIHGVVAYAAGQRTREVGIRRALGASAARAVGVVLAQGMRPVVAGLAVGAVLSAAAGRAAAGLLFEIPPLDPVSLLAAAALLAAVAAVACYGPARRTARVDPAVALRNE